MSQPWMKIDPSDAPMKAGVYVIYLDGVPVYVGSSANLRARLKEHNVRYGYSRCVHTPWGIVARCDDFHAKIKLSSRYGDWAMLEMRLIRRLQPRFNKIGRRAA